MVTSAKPLKPTVRQDKHVWRLIRVCRMCPHYVGDRKKMDGRCGKTNDLISIETMARSTGTPCLDDRWPARSGKGRTAIVASLAELPKVRRREQSVSNSTPQFPAPTPHPPTPIALGKPAKGLGAIDVMYPLSTGSSWDNNEIRYSLRSAAKYFLDIGRVWIAGYKPEWLTGVMHIPVADSHRKNKDANLIDKVLAACRSGISERFVRLSDDQMFLRPIRFDNMWPLHSADLTNKKDSNWGDGSWWRRVKQTRDELVARGHECVKNYDTHCPMPYDRDQFVTVATQYDYPAGDGFTINTLYCNAAQVGGVPVRGWKYTARANCADTERIRREIERKTYLGYSDAGLTDAFKQVLAEMFGEA